MAKVINAEVHILHIAPVIPANEDEEETVHPMVKIMINKVEQQDWGQLRSEALRLEKMAQHNGLDVPVEFHFEEGYFKETVLDFVEEHNIDLIVVGTAGSNSLDKKLFGSHTEKLLNSVRIPLMAIPAEAKFSALKNYGAGVMLNASEIPITERVADAIAPYGRTLQCIHIVKDSAEHSKAELNKAAWLSKIRSKNICLKYRPLTMPSSALKHLCLKKNIGVLLIIHRNLTFFQRMFSKVHSTSLMNHSKTALLIFPML